MSATTQLFERCLAGDPGSIEAVFQTYRRSVFRLAYATLLDSERAGRAMQAGLISVLSALRPGISEEDFQRLLFQHVLIACQKERSQAGWQKALQKNRPKVLQRPTQTQPGLNGTAPPAATPTQYPDAITRRKMGLWHAVCALPEAQRVALILRYEFELPVESVARILRSSPGVVHARLSAARQVLGAALDELMAPPGRAAQGAGHE